MAIRINLPPLTRAIIIANFSLSVIFAALRYRAWASHPPTPPSNSDNGTSAGEGQVSPALAVAAMLRFLTVVPAYALFTPWTFIMAAFIESNIISLLITLATFFYGGKYLERAWGSNEFAKFLLVCSAIPNLLTFLVYLVLYGASGNINLLYTIICGGVALQAGFMVAFKQLVPEHTVTLFKGIIKVRVKHFPAIFLIANMISGPLFGTYVAAILSFFGFMTSWTYLRFYKRSFPDLSTAQSASLRGDASETFAIAHFFPDPLHTPIAIVASAVYNMLVAIRVCTPFSDADVQAGNMRVAQTSGDGGLSGFFSAGGMGSGGGGRIQASRAEAERRRALALKALDQRLHAATARTGSPSGPSGVAAGSNGQEVLGATSLNQDRDASKTGP